MNPATQTSSLQDVLWALEGGLPSLATHAALELDNLILGLSRELHAVKHLALIMNGDKVEYSGISSLPRSLHNDPMTAFVVNRAIHESGLSEHAPTTVNELIKHAEAISKRLKAVIRAPKKSRNDLEELKKLRDFCLKLSSLASASAPSIYDFNHAKPFGG